jgi:hypothetical protein
MRLTGDTKTVCLNRAVQVYAYLQQVLAAAGTVSVQEAPGQEPVRLKLL